VVVAFIPAESGPPRVATPVHVPESAGADGRLAVGVAETAVLLGGGKVKDGKEVAVLVLAVFAVFAVLAVVVVVVARKEDVREGV